jgi:hypothetical protein
MPRSVPLRYRYIHSAPKLFTVPRIKLFCLYFTKYSQYWKIFQIKVVNRNQIYILYYAQFFLRWVVSEKIDSGIILELHVKWGVCFFDTTQKCNRSKTFSLDRSIKFDRNSFSRFENDTCEGTDRQTRTAHYAFILCISCKEHIKRYSIRAYKNHIK